MKKGKHGLSFLAGMVTMALILVLCVPAVAAGSMQTLQNVMVGGIRIVIDGQELHPADAKGNPVDPMIYNGTTYLPVRAVASALGKAVYWDGPSYTVYLGDMDGALEYPTVMLKDMTSIATTPTTTDRLADNYGNRYSSAIIYQRGNLNLNGQNIYEYLLGMKYSRFKAILYVPEGETTGDTAYLTVSADGRILYTSPEMDKTTSPVVVDVDVTGYNDVTIEWNGTAWWNTDALAVCLADAGFYQ